MLKNSTDASLTQMLSLFEQDIADDGTIEDERINFHIESASSSLSVDNIRKNIIEYYNTFGKKIEIENFSDYVVGLSSTEKPIDEASPVKIEILLSPFKVTSRSTRTTVPPSEISAKYIIKMQ